MADTLSTVCRPVRPRWVVGLSGPNRLRYETMTTVTAPAATHPLRVPSIREVWMTAQMHPDVARTLIICATVAFMALVGGLVLVSWLGGEVVGIANALSIAAGAISLAVIRAKGGKSDG